MAIADYDNTDQSMKYLNDMTNNNYYKSQNSELVKKIKCNNINANLHGVGVNLAAPTSNNALAEAQTGDENQATTTAAVNGWENGERNNNGNDFRFICINNNDNENNVIVVNETTPIPPEQTTATLIVNKTTICDQ